MILTTMISVSIIIAAIFFMSFSFLFFLSSFFSVSQNNVLKGQRMRRRRRTRPPPLALPFPFCFRAPGLVVAAWHYASVAAGGRLLARSCRRSFACVRIDGDVCCNATALSLFCHSRHGASGGTLLLRSVRTRLLILVRLILIYGSHYYSLFILLLVTFECGYYDSNRSWAVT